MSEFFQDPPRVGSLWRQDPLLATYLERVLPAELFRELEPGLAGLGERAAGEIAALGEAAEREPPRHVPFDAWGRRIDRIETSTAWRTLHALAAEEGIVATAYERAHGPFSRIHQFARLFLFHPTSAFVACPLAMTDGAARTLELYGAEPLRRRVVPHLISRDPEEMWTSGQWMTERIGGSDVADSETVARRAEGGFRLSGTKWFCSAATAEVALTLARIEGAPSGNEGLSLFFLQPRDEQGRFVGVEILRLKEKLGTRALPTAEIALNEVTAELVGEEGRGVATIASVLNMTRLWNACCAASAMRHALALAQDYARRRRSFGRLLAEQPLHRETLAALAAESEGALLLTFRAAELLGREECGEASAEEEALLRLLTPLVKLLTGKQAVAVVSEVLEAVGGAAYIEDTGFPRLLRDAQVFPIWEGTTNVLALDALRAIRKEGALPPLVGDLRRRLAAVRAPELDATRALLAAQLAALEHWFSGAAAGGRELLAAGARSFAIGLARAYAGALLCEQADFELARAERLERSEPGDHRGGARALDAARRFAEAALPATTARAETPAAAAP